MGEGRSGRRTTYRSWFSSWVRSVLTGFAVGKAVRLSAGMVEDGGWDGPVAKTWGGADSGVGMSGRSWMFGKQRTRQRDNETTDNRRLS
jgi:hypothetical protein